MKKVITLIVALAAAVSLSAQGLDFGMKASAGFSNKGAYVNLSSGIVPMSGLYAGIGTGFQYTNYVASFTPENYHEYAVMVPVFAQLRYSFLKSDVKPFLDAKVGLMSDFTNKGTGHFFWPEAGVAYKNIGLEFGYQWFMCSYGTDAKGSTPFTIGLTVSF